jgi:hypothetical protein
MRHPYLPRTPSGVTMFVLRIVTRMMRVLMGVRVIMDGPSVLMRVRMNDNFSCAVARTAILRADFSRTSTLRTFFHTLCFAFH